MKFLKYGLALWIGCCTMAGAYGQIANADTAFVEASVANAIQSYRQAIGSQAPLYTGQEYLEYRRLNREGHQFFLTDEFTNGSVVYEGSYYTGIPLAYDLVRDQLIIRNRANTLTQLLVPEKVTYFHLHGHTFVRYTTDSLATSSLPVGFYNLLFRGKVMLLAKRTKTVEEKPENYKILQIFKGNERYYVYKGGTYHQVRRKGNIYNVFKERKKELQRFAREQGLNFRDRKEEAFVALVAHYNRITE